LIVAAFRAGKRPVRGAYSVDHPRPMDLETCLPKVPKDRRGRAFANGRRFLGHTSGQRSRGLQCYAGRAWDRISMCILQHLRTTSVGPDFVVSIQPFCSSFCTNRVLEGRALFDPASPSQTLHLRRIVRVSLPPFIRVRSPGISRRHQAPFPKFCAKPGVQRGQIRDWRQDPGRNCACSPARR
jgi:hypothetical protein